MYCYRVQYTFYVRIQHDYLVTFTIYVFNIINVCNIILVSVVSCDVVAICYNVQMFLKLVEKCTIMFSVVIAYK